MAPVPTGRWDQLRVDGERLHQRIEALGEIGAIRGAGGERGCARPALTDADRDGRDLVVTWMRDLGLIVEVDQIGNVFATRPGTDPAVAPVMTGSHIDTGVADRAVKEVDQFPVGSVEHSACPQRPSETRRSLQQSDVVAANCADASELHSGGSTTNNDDAASDIGRFDRQLMLASGKRVGRAPVLLIEKDPSDARVSVDTRTHRPHVAA